MKAIFLTLCAMALLSCKSGSRPAPTQGKAIAWAHSQAADEAASYLVRHLGKEGRFDYLRRSDIKATKYNLLRHAGAIYALIQYHARQDSPQVREAILRAASYLRSRYIRAPKGHPDLLAAFSRPEEEKVKTGTAKLGGAGLSLIALCGAYHLDASAVPLADLQALGRFILFMQLEDGSFHSKYFEASGYDPEFHSLYYPGEAMLALTKLYEIDKDPKWLAAGLRTAEHLVTSREGVKRPPADHWMMLSGGPLLDLHEHVATPAIAQANLREHLGLLGQIMMSDQEKVRSKAPAMEHGGFDRDGRSTPTATRLEGMLSLLRIQRSVDEVQPGLRESIQHGLAFLMRCQIKSEGPNQGGMPRSCAEDAGDQKRDLEIRIDYVQHYLSALLSAQELGLL